jgi:hypothetical protein
VAVESAARQFFPIPQRDHEFAIIAGLKFFDFAHIHNERPVNTDELRWVQLIGHSADRFPKQISILARYMEAHVVSRSFDPVDFIDLD